jgi:hypothetical protein
MTNIFEFCSSTWGLIVSLLGIFTTSILFFILTLCKIRVVKSAKAFTFCVILGLSSILLASDLALGKIPHNCLFIFGVGVILYSPLNLLKEKTKEPKELIKQIDREILGEEKAVFQNTNQVKPRNIEKSLVVNKVEQPKDKSPELDYSHVKNILERLDYYSLNGSDKKTVNELENSLALAEKGDSSTENKTRINDGLGALLKIMSKYGV